MNIPSLDMRILQNCNVNAGDDRELSEHSADDILMILQNIFSSKVKLQSSEGQMDFHLNLLKGNQRLWV